MKMKRGSRTVTLVKFVLVGACLLAAGQAARALTDELFAFDNGLQDIKGLEAKAQTLKELGYSGIGWRPNGETAAMLKVLDRHDLKMVSTYVSLRVGADPLPLSDRIKNELRALEGRDTIVWLTLLSGEGGTDESAVAMVREVAKISEEVGLEVALYPHAGCHVETVEDALRMADEVDRPNVGVSFNLCHFLKTGSDQNLKAVLRKAAPQLRIVSINGADRGDTHAMGWARLIQPLGEGTFPVERLLAALDEVGYEGPIGLQCFNVPGEDREHLRRSIRSWRRLIAPWNRDALFSRAAESEYGQSRAALARIVELITDAPADRQREFETHSVALLEDPDASCRSKRTVCHLLSRIGTAESVPALAALLTDPQLSHDARYALQALACPEADRALTTALDRVPAPLTTGVAASLGTRRVEAAVPVLAQRLSDDGGDPALRHAVLTALGRIASDRALAVLREEFARTPSGPVGHALILCADTLTADDRREMAAELCLHLWREAPSPLCRAAALRSLAHCAPDPAAERVAEALRDPARPVREAGVALVSGLPVKATLHAATEALPSVPDRLKVRLLTALRERGDPAARPAVLAILDHNHDDVRLAALRTMETIGAPEDTGRLLEIALSGDGDVSKAAGRALARLPGRDVSRRLAEAFRRADVERQPGICSLLAARNDPADRPLFRTWIRHPSPEVARYAGQALGRLGEASDLDLLFGMPGSPDFPGTSRPAVEAAVMSIAERLPADEAAQRVRDGLDKSGPEERAMRLRILAEIGGEASLEAVVQASRNEDDRVRDAAVRALCAWKRPEALNPLLKIAADTDSLTHHVLALRACHRLLQNNPEPAGERRSEVVEAAAAIARREQEKKLFTSLVVEIHDLQVRSPRTWRVHPAGLVPGAVWTSDRDYTFVKVPDGVWGHTYLEGVMQDRAIGGDEPFIRFRIETPATVYVAYDHRCTDLPDWLADWENTGERLTSTSTPSDLILYRKRFPAGPVALGSPAAPGTHAVYVVAVVRQEI
ncbi:HEAT repeat domain-containing protein [Kiritimatiella glycovorans]|uniref:Inosose isomerase n=1 Tax=Kiritimatiella glycovorans TaxID=1307763 RepID=A0A0G3EFC2_9BACT|nr:HEAT repeat domain-containing protein [Kiritimatiella glycovorans]AKJ65151.1 Inosose isomerase [Kiritimatiella glycovorans]